MRPGLRHSAALLVLLLLGPALVWGRPALVVYPGSFDPIHNTHRAELGAVLDRLKAEHPDGVRALVLPQHDRPNHVPGNRYVFTALQRHYLARQAFADRSEVTVRRAFPDGMETADQLQRVAAAYGDSHDLYLLLGADAYQGLRHWVRYHMVLSRFDLLVSVQPAALEKLPPPEGVLGTSGRAFRAAGDHDYAGGGRRIRYLPVDVPPVRSRAIVVNLMAGDPVDAWVPAAVAQAFALPPFAQAILQARRATAHEMARLLAPFAGAEAARRLSADDRLAIPLLRVRPTTAPEQAREQLATFAAGVERSGTRVSLRALTAYALSQGHQGLFLPPRPSERNPLLSWLRARTRGAAPAANEAHR